MPAIGDGNTWESHLRTLVPPLALAIHSISFFNCRQITHVSILAAHGGSFNPFSDVKVGSVSMLELSMQKTLFGKSNYVWSLASYRYTFQFNHCIDESPAEIIGCYNDDGSVERRAVRSGELVQVEDG